MIEKLNKKGQTFSEFLAEYKKMDYPPNAVTVDDVVFAIRNEKPTVLLIKRGDFPYIDDWALPGGFVDEMESVKVAAVRELQEETGIKGVELEPLCTVSTPNRDPRVESISKCFFGVCSATSELKAADDASDAKWFEVDYAAIGDTYELVLKADNIVLNAVMKIKRFEDSKIDIDTSGIVSQNGIAFDHAKIILYAVESL